MVLAIHYYAFTMCDFIYVVVLYVIYNNERQFTFNFFNYNFFLLFILLSCLPSSLPACSCCCGRCFVPCSTIIYLPEAGMLLRCLLLARSDAAQMRLTALPTSFFFSYIVSVSERAREKHRKLSSPTCTAVSYSLKTKKYIQH